MLIDRLDDAPQRDWYAAAPLERGMTAGAELTAARDVTCTLADLTTRSEVETAVAAVERSREGASSSPARSA